MPGLECRRGQPCPHCVNRGGFAMTALRPLIPEHRKRSLRLGHDKPYASSFHYRQDQERMSQRGCLPIACLPGGPAGICWKIGKEPTEFPPSRDLSRHVTITGRRNNKKLTQLMAHAGYELRLCIRLSCPSATRRLGAHECNRPLAHARLGISLTAVFSTSSPSLKIHVSHFGRERA